MTYTWTDNAMQGGGSCNVDTVNQNLMHLKYDNVSPQDGKVPYSVCSGKTTNGYANFISKVDNNTVSFDTSTSLVCVYPDGSTETITSLANVSGLTNDGTYTFIKEKGNSNIIATTQTDGNVIQTPIMSAMSQNGYVVTASFSNNSPYEPFRLFDQNKTTYGNFTPVGNSLGYICIQYPSAKPINFYKFRVPGGYTPPTSWVIEGSNNGSTWSQLDSKTGQSLSTETDYLFKISLSSYSYYRFTSNAQINVSLVFYNLDYILNNTIENIVVPSNPNTNDYNLDISQKPYIPKKYNGTSWNSTQFVKLGTVSRISGVLGTPVSYSFNGQFIGVSGLESIIGAEFTQTITSSGNLLTRRAF